MPRLNEETMTQSAQAVRREALTEVTLSLTRYVNLQLACVVGFGGCDLLSLLPRDDRESSGRGSQAKRGAGLPG